MDVNYLETDDCLNLTRVRDVFNSFNDTRPHSQYVPQLIPPIDHLTYLICTWILLSAYLSIMLYFYIKFENYIKSNKINLMQPKDENVIVNRFVDNSSKIEVKELVEDIDDLNEIVTVEELVQRKRTKQLDTSNQIENDIAITTSDDSNNSFIENTIESDDELFQKRLAKKLRRKFNMLNIIHENGIYNLLSNNLFILN